MYPQFTSSRIVYMIQTVLTEVIEPKTINSISHSKDPIKNDKIYHKYYRHHQF